MDEELKDAWAKVREARKTVKDCADSLKEARKALNTAQENLEYLLSDEAAGQQRMFRNGGSAAATA